jgi:hypothetical protein
LALLLFLRSMPAPWLMNYSTVLEKAPFARYVVDLHSKLAPGVSIEMSPPLSTVLILHKNTAPIMGCMFHGKHRDIILLLGGNCRLITKPVAARFGKSLLPVSEPEAHEFSPTFCTSPASRSFS